MYKQKLTFDPKCTAVREAFLTIFDEKPLGSDITYPEGFEVVECGKISEEQVKERKARAAFSVTGNIDVGIIDIECVSVKGNILPAEFGMVYSFQVANFSDTDIAQVPVTIYFNPQGSSLVEQGTTTITNIPAGHYQLLQFSFPPVEAGNWVMTLEANKSRIFEESTYDNNVLSRSFVYTDQAELVAVSVEDIQPMVNDDGDNYFPLNTERTLEFTINNIGSADANNLLVQVPAAFQDQTGTYSTMLAETRMNLSAHTGGRAQLTLSFTKDAVAQIGLLVNGDKSCPEISYDNNETHEIFVIGNPNAKPNPDTGGAIKEYIEEVELTEEELRKVYRVQRELYRYTQEEIDKKNLVEFLSDCSSILEWIFKLPTPVQIAGSITNLLLGLESEELDVLNTCLSVGREFLDDVKTHMEDHPEFDKVRMNLPFIEYVGEGFRFIATEGEVLAFHLKNGGWISLG